MLSCFQLVQHKTWGLHLSHRVLVCFTTSFSPTLTAPRKLFTSLGLVVFRAQVSLTLPNQTELLCRLPSSRLRLATFTARLVLVWSCFPSASQLSSSVQVYPAGRSQLQSTQTSPFSFPFTSNLPLRPFQVSSQVAPTNEYSLPRESFS